MIFLIFLLQTITCQSSCPGNCEFCEYSDQCSGTCFWGGGSCRNSSECKSNSYNCENCPSYLCLGKNSFCKWNADEEYCDQVCSAEHCNACKNSTACKTLSNNCTWYNQEYCEKSNWKNDFLGASIAIALVVTYLVCICLPCCCCCCCCCGCCRKCAYCFNCCGVYPCDLANNHKKYMEVVGFSTLKFHNCCNCGIGNFFCWLIFLGVMAIFIIFPVSFAGAARDHQDMIDSLKESEDGQVYFINQWGEPVVVEHPDFPIFFFLMNDYEDGRNFFLQILVVTSSIWGVLDFIVTAIVIYRKMSNAGLDKELCCTCCDRGDTPPGDTPPGDTPPDCCCGSVRFKPFMLMISMVAVHVIIYGCELVGFFSTLTAFLAFWPISNILRLLDGVQSLIFRTNLECMSCCYVHSLTPSEKPKGDWDFRYTFGAWVLDVLGQGFGFNIQGDPLWEKILALALEIFDIVFSLIYTMYDFDIATPSIFLLNIVCVIKIISLAVNITLSLKGFIWFGRYSFSLYAGMLLGLVTFVCFLLMLLRSMHVYTGASHLAIICPLLILISLYGCAAFCCGQMRLETKQSIFHRDMEHPASVAKIIIKTISKKGQEEEEEEKEEDAEAELFWDGECCLHFGESPERRKKRWAQVRPKRVNDIIELPPDQQPRAQSRLYPLPGRQQVVPPPHIVTPPPPHIVPPPPHIVPPPAHDYVPSPAHDYVPPPAHDYVPPPAHDLVPPPAHDLVPPPAHDLVPPPAHDLVPPPAHDLVPPPAHDLVPPPAHDHVPPSAHNYAHLVPPPQLVHVPPPAHNVAHFGAPPQLVPPPQLVHSPPPPDSRDVYVPPPYLYPPPGDEDEIEVDFPISPTDSGGTEQ